jgi:hypothetical protein
VRRLALLAACAPTSPPPIPIPPSPRVHAAPSCSYELAVAERAELVDNTMIVRGAIRDHRGAFLNCYTVRAVHVPSLEGRVVMHFRVKHGVPTDVRVVGFDEPIDRCLCARLFDLDLGGLDADFDDYPFVFKATAPVGPILDTR